MAYNIKANFGKEEEIFAEYLFWDTEYKSEKKYDIVLIADCLYCIPYQQHLINTVRSLMHEKSVCFMTAPQRGYSLDKFIAMMKSIPDMKITISSEITKEVDERIKELRKLKSFSESEHQPFLITITYF